MKSDVSGSVKALIQAAEAEHDDHAMETLYLAYLNGHEGLGVKPDMDEAVKWLKSYAATRNPVALYNLGLHYVKGCGVERDYGKALEYLQAAAKMGDEDAAALAEKVAVMPGKLEAARAGDAQAAADCARFLMEMGKAITLGDAEGDFAECIRWAEQAAEKNNGDGLWVLALAYEHGRGVPKDLNRAAEYDRRGAEQGHAACQNRLGCMYLDGEPMPRDMETGFSWILRSAEQGNAEGMYNLAHCYQFGHGVQEDMDKAIEWYAKANEQLHDPQLTMKIAAFRQMQTIKPAADERAPLPKGYMEAMAKAEAEFEIRDRTLVKYRGSDAHVKLPNGLREVGSRAFVINDHLESVEITPGIRVIGEKAFMGCHSLRSVTLPDTLEVIGDYGFANCERMEQIDLPGGLTTIGECAFTNCTGLRRVVIPEGVKVIGNGAFSFCSGLECVVLPEGLTTIEHDAFANCSALKEMNRPASLTQIGYDAFSGCGSLPDAPQPTGEKTTTDEEDMMDFLKKLTGQDTQDTVERIMFGSFFSVVPEDGLIIAMHKSAEFKEKDTVAELFNTSFGREVELGLFGGFQNGVDIILKEKTEFTAEQLEKIGEKVIQGGTTLVRHPRLVVFMGNMEVKGAPVRYFLFYTQQGVLACFLNLNTMSDAEAESYRRMFATALPVGAEEPAADKPVPAEGGARKRRSERFGHAAAADVPVEKQDTHEQKLRQLKTMGERLFDDFMKERNRILTNYNKESHQAYMESDFGDISKMFRIRTRFRRIINDAAGDLRRCMHELSNDGEKLVPLGADIAFINRMISTLQDALEDLKMDIDLEEFGGHSYSYEIPADTLALVSKWHDILTSHPDYAADLLRRRREEETKRLHGEMDRLRERITALQEESAACPQTVRQAEEACKASASTLEQRIAAVRERYDDELREKEEHRDWLKGQQEVCAQQTQQTREELNRTFILAFGRKKALQAQLDELNQRSHRLDQEISDVIRSIDGIRAKKADEQKKLEQAHVQLKDALEQAQQRLAQLPVELAGAQDALANARMRLDRVPDMTLEELSALTEQPDETDEKDVPVPQPSAPAPAIQTIMTQGDIVDIMMQVLAGSSGMTISEIMSSDPELEKLSNQRIATIVRHMCDDGRLEREERNRKAYFRLR